ncbi:O-antigen ligase family protein [Pseudoalteromonas sp. NZS11]|uniref:O-antigen ligase family protein n=1 Tax=Pseudoalteromonas sp. NZS11 TaxID=2792049 RepID=UPI0018CDE157|nr:O-antigen ligase family protein [Pseudoalteromonas sp. NZS11]MBH0078160.1 O-antigen ligase family protein [Pseudoalteromonas sp. NZS11]
MKKKSLVSFAAVLFISSIPFYDVPQFPVPGITWSFFFGSIFLFLYFIILRRTERRLTISIYPFLAFAVFLIIYMTSYIYNFTNLDGRGFNHIIFYMITFFFYYFCFYLALNFLGKACIQKIIYFGLAVIALVGTVEILMFFIYGFSEYENFLNHGGNVGVYGGLFPRMRSLFNEPSHLALFVVSCSVFIWDIGLRARLLVVYILFWTFSTSAAFGIAAAVLVYNLYKSCINRRAIYKINLLLLIIIPASLFGLLTKFPLFSKLFNMLSGSGSSDSVRLTALLESIKYVGNSPLIGLGPTFYYNYSETGLFNLYMQLYIEAGLLGVLFFLLFYFYHIKAALIKPVYFIAFFSLFFQYIGMDHYYIPGIWMMLAYMHYDSWLYKKTNRTDT